MKIAAVKSRVPSRCLDNQALLEHIESFNPSVGAKERSRYLKLVHRLLERSGASSRYWRDFDGDERASELILGAIADALDTSGISATDIDVVIYCGVGKGFLEPANAYFYANALGMKTANCFDITDACMSWIRALEMAELMMAAGRCRNVMIVNGEFHLGLHDNWEIRDVRSLEYTFPMYTIGEAATATILVPSESSWQFDYSSRPEFADLCTIPLDGHNDFIAPNERVGLNGLYNFVSYGKELFREAEAVLCELVLKSIKNFSEKDWYFPHAPSKTIYEEGLDAIGVPLEKVYLKTFPAFGNIVSASIPVGLSAAEKDGELKRGDSVVLIPASAGLVTSVVQFTY